MLCNFNGTSVSTGESRCCQGFLFERNVRRAKGRVEKRKGCCSPDIFFMILALAAAEVIKNKTDCNVRSVQGAHGGCLRIWEK